jgi:uncharacterized lipoprotein
MNKIKQTLIAIAIATVVAACGSNKTENANTEDYGTPDETAAPVIAKRAITRLINS